MVAGTSGGVIGIRSIGTAVPPTVIRQEALRDLLRRQPGLGRLGSRLVTAAFDASQIETRHSVLPEFGAEADPAHPSLYGVAGGEIDSPGTGARNDVYRETAPGLLVEAARAALAEARGLEAADVTHVVTVSCTGFFAPGPEQVLVRELGLSPRVQRYHLGFLGCYGVFPALRAAKQFCEADPEAVVLVVSVELCSLHLHVRDDPDTIVASSVFADGAAAALVTGRQAPEGSLVYDLDAFETTVVDDGRDEMAWAIGDEGFEMVLSSYVPKILEKHARDALGPLFEADHDLHGVEPATVSRWAIHPGGRSILDRVQTALALSDAQLICSRETLRQFGNMSSATVLFVLQEVLRSAPPSAGASERVCALAFGPGLTVESALLTLRTV